MGSLHCGAIHTSIPFPIAKKVSTFFEIRSPQSNSRIPLRKFVSCLAPHMKALEKNISGEAVEFNEVCFDAEVFKIHVPFFSIIHFS